jgi:signal recognition particle subunit SRP54
MLGLGSGMPSPEQMAKLAEKMPGGLPPGGLPPGMPGAPGLPPTVPGLPPRFPGNLPGLSAPKLPGLGGFPGPGKKR